MAKLLLSLVLFFSSYVYADNYDEILGGALTYHLFDPGGQEDQAYRNKLDSKGMLIDNFMAGFRQVEVSGVSYTSRTFFTGENSIAEPMFGAAWSTGYIVDGVRFGLVAGIYFQNSTPMLDRGVTPIMFIPYNGWGPSPLLGAEMTKTFDISKSCYFIINGLLTPLFINGTIGIGWRI